MEILNGVGNWWNGLWNQPKSQADWALGSTHNIAPIGVQGYGAGFGSPQVVGQTTPPVGGAGGLAGGGGGGYQPLEFGMNMPTAQLGLSGLNTAMNLWGGIQGMNLAKDAFKFQKDMANKNYANTLKNYNTTLTDRATTRGFVQGDSQAVTDKYIKDNRL